MPDKKKSEALSFSVELDHDKETKGTHRYSTTDDDAAVSTVYIRKSAFGKVVPDSITLTIVST